MWTQHSLETCLRCEFLGPTQAVVRYREARLRLYAHTLSESPVWWDMSCMGTSVWLRDLCLPLRLQGTAYSLLSAACVPCSVLFPFLCIYLCCLCHECPGRQKGRADISTIMPTVPNIDLGKPLLLTTQASEALEAADQTLGLFHEQNRSQSFDYLLSGLAAFLSG